MKITIEGEAKEIAALVLELQEQQDSPPVGQLEPSAPGCKLRGLWERAGYTVASLSKVLDIDESMVAQWANGETIPRAYQCVILSEILKCPLSSVYRALIQV